MVLLLLLNIVVYSLCNIIIVFDYHCLLVKLMVSAVECTRSPFAGCNVSLLIAIVSV